MKKTLLFTLLLLLFSNIYSQNKLSIELKDGTVLEGLGRIKVDETILFKKAEGAEKEIYNYKTVKKLVIYSDNSQQEYEYKVVEDSGGLGSIKLIEIIKTGKVTLYQDYASGVTYGPNMSGGYGFSSYSKTTYYISKSGSDVVTNLRIGNTYSKRFKKIAKRYFNDCPDLLEKINSKFFKRYGINAVVEYYNKKCTN
jgi:hypothetical protein